jgi:hypothetical protein
MRQVDFQAHGQGSRSVAPAERAILGSWEAVPGVNLSVAGPSRPLHSKTDSPGLAESAICVCRQGRLIILSYMLKAVPYSFAAIDWQAAQRSPESEIHYHCDNALLLDSKSIAAPKEHSWSFESTL